MTLLTLPLSLLFSFLATTGNAASTPAAGSIVQVGNTLVSAMMMFVGNENTVFILDKVENNSQTISGHPAWAAQWDLTTDTASLMDIATNTFCASGGVMPNGTWAVFGGNKAVGPSCDPNGGACAYDGTYGDNAGATAIRLLSPCTTPGCSAQTQWNDNGSLNMVKERWYPGIEVLPDGGFVLLGGFVNGGFINRNYPDNSKDKATQDGAAEPTFEFWPPRGDLQVMDLMTRTGGLNSYAHMYLMPSGLIFVQANVSTVMWNYTANTEVELPDMPNNVARVYPASGAVAMLPLTPDNNYTPTILFCGGQNIPDDQWGSYDCPIADVTQLPASKDCQRITPEPTDGSPVSYVQDDDLLDGRTMGQFIILPDETLLIVNGGANGTAGYSEHTGLKPDYKPNQFGQSLATEPVFTPAVYNPTAPKGQRWSNAGFEASTIPRLYHSSATLLPDGSVMIAGSNPNVDVNTSTIFPTTYVAEKFYPSYFKSTNRPTATGIPNTLSYGGNPFDITLPSTAYTGSANDAASATRVVVIRTGFSTHAMNMGQKALRLNTTYTVNDDGSITVHCSQMPNNPNLFQPGSALLFVVVGGVPSKGSLVIVGNGQLGAQPSSNLVDLPISVNNSKISSSGPQGGDGKSAALSISIHLPWTAAVISFASLFACILAL